MNNSKQTKKFEEPLILGTNLFACGLGGGPLMPGFVMLAATFKTGGMVAVAALCNAPAVATIMSVGIVA